MNKVNGRKTIIDSTPGQNEHQHSTYSDWVLVFKRSEIVSYTMIYNRTKNAPDFIQTIYTPTHTFN